MFKKIHRELKKESCRKIGNGFLVMALICCLMFVSYQATSAVITSAKVGDRELPIYCVDTTEKKVALSFDAAWGAEDFPRIMDVLDKHKVKVTFFMTGGWVEDNPDCVKELVKRGHDLGNHSEHHYDMTTISQEEKDSELKTVHDKVKKLTGYEMYLFRPPYGAYDNDVIKTRTPCIIIRFSGQWIVWIGRIMVWILLSRRFATIKHLHREPLSSVTMEQNIRQMRWIPC